MALKIGASDMDHIHEHAKEAYPEECAGVLVGMDTGEMKVVVDVWRADNTHEGERERRFLIDPLKIKEFEDTARERDLDILGFYHSHPRPPCGALGVRPRPRLALLLLHHHLGLGAGDQGHQLLAPARRPLRLRFGTGRRIASGNLI